MSPRQLAHPVLEPDDGLVGDASPELRFVPYREAEERPVPRSGNSTLLRVDLKLQAPFDEAGQALHNPPAGLFAAHVDITVIRVAHEPVAATLKLAIQFIQHEILGDVAMGQIGAIFALEASRLARSNQDWHRLLELCAITGTLVIDEDGCYDPAEFNDSLVLGMKGTFAQAELHIIRARLHGGKLNKASRGELRFPLPVGFVFEDDKIVLDPDREVQGAVRMAFDLFEREATAYGAVRRFQELGLRFPRRAYGGAWNGKLLWGRLTHSRMLGILANPSRCFQRHWYIG